MNVWVLGIDNKYGIDITVYSSFELAEQVLLEYVAENWDEEWMEMPLPKNTKTAIDEYFGYSDRDTYYLESVMVQTGKTNEN